MAPVLTMADKGSAGFLFPPGLLNQNNGAAITAGGNVDQPFFVNFFTTGSDSSHPNAQATTLRIWSRGNAVGGADNGIEGFYANGPFASPTYAKCGDKLLKLAGFGYATNGYAVNDAAVIYLNADQDFSDHDPVSNERGVEPSIANTKAGGSVSIETCNIDENSQRIRCVWDASANMALGEYQRAGNGFPVKGGLVIKNATLPPTAAVSGSGILYSEGGHPHWRAQTSASNQSVPLRSNDNLPNEGDAVVWKNDREVKASRVCRLSWDASGAIKKALNIASILKIGTGDVRINFHFSFPDANSFVPMFFGQGAYRYAGHGADWIRVQSFDSGGNFKDFDVNYLVVGEL